MSKDLTEDLRKLMESGDASANVVPSLKPRGAAPKVVGSALLKPATAGSGGAGIAWPLIETAYSARTKHADLIISTTDGLWSFKIPVVKDIYFKDANDVDGHIQFKAP